MRTGSACKGESNMTIRDEAYLGQPISAFIVDSHTHIGPYYMNGWYQSPTETTNAAIVRSMDRLGIDWIVTAPHPLVPGMMAVANETAARAVKEFPDRIRAYVSICPGEGMEAVKEQLRRHGSDPGFVGLKFLAGYHGPLSQPEYQYAADFADERSAVVLTHTWGDTPPLTDVERLATEHPHMKLLCAHQGGGAKPLSIRLASIIQRQANLFMEICGSLINPLAIEDLVELAGEDRVVYGSDLINLDPRYDFGRVVFSPLPDSVKRKLLSGNYLSLLRDSQMGRIRG